MKPVIAWTRGLLYWQYKERPRQAWKRSWTPDSLGINFSCSQLQPPVPVRSLGVCCHSHHGPQHERTTPGTSCQCLLAAVTWNHCNKLRQQARQTWDRRLSPLFMIWYKPSLTPITPELMKDKIVFLKASRFYLF